MREMITPAERIETQFAKLGTLLRKGAIDQDVFNRKATALREEYETTTPAYEARIKAEKEQNAAMERGRQITASLITQEERHANLIEDLNQLKRKGAIDQETLNRAVDRSSEKLPAVIAMKKKLADVERKAIARKKKLAESWKKVRLATAAAAAVGAGLLIRSVNRQIDRVDALQKACLLYTSPSPRDRG